MRRHRAGELLELPSRVGGIAALFGRPIQVFRRLLERALALVDLLTEHSHPFAERVELLRAVLE
jgi:hypothetical protein